MGTRGCKYQVLSKEVDAGIEFRRTVGGAILDILRNPKNAVRKMALKRGGSERMSHDNDR